MTFLTKALAAPAILAAASLTAIPAVAAELPTSRHAPVASASHYGPYYGGHWGGGYRHRRGSSAGDILGGILILGTIAAVASAASKANRTRSYPQPYPYPDRRGDYRPQGPQGLEGAADLCMREVERNARAREVTRVERSASGWLVTGAMADGAAFSCSIGADGRIDRVDVGGRAQVLGDNAPQYDTAPQSGTDRQYDDERYRSARADIDSGADGAVHSGPQPAYPGGPLPGEDVDGADLPEYTPAPEYFPTVSSRADENYRSAVNADPVCVQTPIGGERYCPARTSTARVRSPTLTSKAMSVRMGRSA